MTENDAVAQITWGYFCQQDKAPPHYANIVMDFLNAQLLNKWIGKGSLPI
jgi:hypothetical protein